MARSATSTFGKRLAQKKGFLLAVYALLAAELAIASMVANYIRKNPDVQEKLRKYYWLRLLVTIAVLIPLVFVPGLPIAVKIFLFTCIAILIGASSMAASKYIEADTIRGALIATAGVFVAMSIFGLGLAALGVDLGFLTWILFAGLIGLIVAYITLLFVEVSRTIAKVIFGFAVTLFSIYIAYDTNMILGRDYSGDFVQAALDFFLDVINLFSSLLNFGSD